MRIGGSRSGTDRQKVSFSVADPYLFLRLIRNRGLTGDGGG